MCSLHLREKNQINVTCVCGCLWRPLPSCTLAPCSAEWKEREKIKHIDPMELVERYGLNFVPTAYTKEAVRDWGCLGPARAVPLLVRGDGVKCRDTSAVTYLQRLDLRGVRPPTELAAPRRRGSQLLVDCCLDDVSCGFGAHWRRHGTAGLSSGLTVWCFMPNMSLPLSRVVGPLPQWARRSSPCLVVAGVALNGCVLLPRRPVPRPCSSRPFK